MPPDTERSIADVEADLDAGLNNADLSDELDDTDEIDESQLESQESITEAKAVEEASRKGWVPKEQFSGDPAKWVDAKTFIERGERFNANLQREIKQLKEQIAGFEGTKKAFAKFHQESIAKKDAEMKEAIAELRLQRSAAIREGSDDEAIALEDRIDLLKEQQKELAKPVEQEAAAAGEAKVVALTDPVLEEWVEDGNQWFKDEPKLRDYAIAIGDQLVKDGETARGRKFLDKVTALMAEEFPRRFKATQKEAPRVNAVEGAGNANGSGRVEKTERDLPPEDRKLMREFIAEGWTTKEAFLKSYFSTTK